MLTNPFDTLSRADQTMDGCHAAAHVAYAYSEAVAIFPITPSSPMAELCDEWSGDGRKNIFGHPLVISQMQSEAGAAAAVHGALLAGSLATTFTASQGLLLMLPNLYRMAGELLPGVIHVAARSIAAHALSIFGDHSDIYACRQTGTAIFSESSVQEVMDLSPVAHLAAIEGRIPFVNFFDGFRTSHELHKIKVWDYDDLASMLNTEALAQFRQRSLHPSHGKVYGSAQNPDIFFQAREASNPCYLALPEIVEHTLEKINALLGTSYGLFDYYGSPDAEHVIIAMGSICETIKEFIDGVPEKKYGVINVHLYRPFSTRRLIEKLPKSTRQITVLDRTKEPGAAGEPLYLDVVAALVQYGLQIHVFSGRYGLSSKDTTPDQISAIYENHTKSRFTVGITDDVTHLSLTVPPIQNKAASDVVSCKFWGLGGDGTVSATKNAIKIIGSHTDMDAQGYFEYDSKKSRGLTISHLRFGKKHIRSAYLIHEADLAACHNPVYLHKYDMVQELKDGGIFLLNFHPEEPTPTHDKTRAPLSEASETAAHPKPPALTSCSKEAYLEGSLSTGPADHKISGLPDAAGSNGISHSKTTGNKAMFRNTPQSQNTTASIAKQLDSYLPEKVKAYIVQHSIRLFVIDAIGIGKEIGLNNKVSTILQAAFFAVSGLLDPADAKRWMNEAAEKSYGKSGEKILEMNRAAIERGFAEVMEISLNPDMAPGSSRQGDSDSGAASDSYDGSDFVAAPGSQNCTNSGTVPGSKGCFDSAAASNSQDYSDSAAVSGFQGCSDSAAVSVSLNSSDSGTVSAPQCNSAHGASGIRNSSHSSGIQAALDNTPLPDRPEMLDFVKNIQQPVTDQRGNELPVSAFLPYADGYTPPGSTAHERRGVATELPVWKPENCIQCTRCSFFCPHAVIRPAVLKEAKPADAPKGLQSIPMMGMEGCQFTITISSTDCTGCGTCVAVCPGKQQNGTDKPAKALEMVPVNECLEKGMLAQNQDVFDYCKPLLPCREAAEKFHPDTPKGSQFLRPLMEFSGACAGCGETPYVKLLTQLFGDRMYIANATGCSSIWANSSPSCAYALDENGHGPAWSNSLFEDAAEFGYGMLMAQEAAARRNVITGLDAAEHNTMTGPGAAKHNTMTGPGAAKHDTMTGLGAAKYSAMTGPDTARHDTLTKQDTAGHDAMAMQEAAKQDTITTQAADRHTIQWIIGGDGWAYDIGFSGLDHVLASGKNINILVLNTEVYSNTGGQASKATPLGSTAKFASGGKQTPKKDLAAMAMTYGTVYVAQIAMGADFNQTIRAITEAAAYPGPSLVIAYATCIAHGIRAGMGSTPHEAKKAVDAGYYHLFRFNPALKDQGKNPFLLDSMEPKLDYETFLAGEIRYDSLKRFHPKEAEELFRKAAALAKERYRNLKKLEAFYAPD